MIFARTSHSMVFDTVGAVIDRPYREKQRRRSRCVEASDHMMVNISRRNGHPNSVRFSVGAMTEGISYENESNFG